MIGQYIIDSLSSSQIWQRVARKRICLKNNDRQAWVVELAHGLPSSAHNIPKVRVSSMSNATDEPSMPAPLNDVERGLDKPNTLGTSSIGTRDARHGTALESMPLHIKRLYSDEVETAHTEWLEQKSMGRFKGERVEPGKVLWWTFHSLEFEQMASTQYNTISCDQAFCPLARNEDCLCRSACRFNPFSWLLTIGASLIVLLASPIWLYMDRKAKAAADGEIMIITDTAIRLYQTNGPLHSAKALTLRSEKAVADIFIGDCKIYSKAYQNAWTCTGTRESACLRWRAHNDYLPDMERKTYQHFEDPAGSPKAAMKIMNTVCTRGDSFQRF